MFDLLNQNLDFAWIEANGHTPGSILALRHILYESKTGPLTQERIEQIIMQYEASDYADRIKAQLADFVDLVNYFRNLGS